LSQVRTATLVVIALVGVQLRWSFAGPAIAGITSTHFSNISESCLFAPLTKITSGMPLASTTMCRLEPSLPLSIGLGPVSWPPGGLVPRSHQCWPGSNRFGHVHASESAWPGSTVPRHQRSSSRAGAASKSCRCRSPGIGEGLPMECLFAARTGCR
jgi:hypothetical protein